ncbi:MAG: single-stranded-DNA-specific exonuclease RecJ [Chloroflexi bacterium]|nr:single-stranded-DNA-specific exonuclease RecJ [Chloroflexota bacterium]
MTFPDRPAKRWLPAPPITPEADRALSAHHPVIRQLLFNRNIDNAADAQKYLNAEPPDDDDPMQLAGMGEAVERIERAIAQCEPIAIYGDYDTDGVTATALMVQVLSALGADVRPYIPNRFDEGYGLNNDALTQLKDGGVGLVITVDCGIRSPMEADHARGIGLDLIISDHHTVGDDLPRALAVINPKRADDSYPYRDLAGVGLAYKIAQALMRKREPQPMNRSDVLDLVALGTVSDLAPLTGENRFFVRKGLAVINKAKREGLKALIQTSRLKPGAIDAGNIGFSLGPRLNAAGRLKLGLAAYELLIAADASKANELAGQLEGWNQERQKRTKEIVVKARQKAVPNEADPPPLLFAALTVAESEANFEGVVGLAAARLVEEFYRPAVVAIVGKDKTRGSARSIGDLIMIDALTECKDLFERYGGHAMAAGFTLANGHTEELAYRLHQYVAEKLAGKELKRDLKIDAKIELKDIPEFAQILKQFEPCGYGNLTPVFAVYGVEPKNPKPIGADGTHLRLAFSDGERSVNAVAFKQAYWLKDMPKRVDVVFTLGIDEWQGKSRVQMNVKDMRRSIA